MNYYKLISGSNIIGVGSSMDFRKFQKNFQIWTLLVHNCALQSYLYHFKKRGYHCA